MSTPTAVDTDEVTEIVSQKPDAQALAEGSPARTCLIVISKKRRILKTFQPDKNMVSVGRSRSSDLLISDPAFSRHMGDVILQPEPLFRLKKRRKGSPKVEKLIGGRAISLDYPFKLHYLELGHSMPGNRSKRFQCAALMVFLFFSALLGVGALKFADKKIGDPQFKDVSATSCSTSPIQKLGQPDNASIGISTFPKETAGKNLSPKIKDPVKDGFHQKADRPRRPSKESTILDRQITKKTISEDVFRATLEAATLLIGQGDLINAGQMIMPIFESLCSEQKEEMVTVLDQRMNEIFRKAYLIYPFDRQQADQTLRLIVESGLTILPSHAKARERLVSNRGGRINR